MNQSKRNPERYWHGDDLFWNQSLVFHIYDSKNKVAGHIRIGLLENLKESNNWFIFFIDGKPLYLRNNQNLPYTSKRIDNGVEVAGIRVTSLEPLKTVRIEFSGRGFSLNLLAEELHPMVDCIALSDDEEGTLSKEMTHVHMEGTCRFTGSITYDGGKRIDIDGNGFRDVSVGPRNWDSVLYYGMTWPVFSNGVAFSGIHAISADGRNSFMKMLHDGKQWVRVKRFEDRNAYADDGVTIRSLHWKFWDAKDRMWEYTGKSLYSWPYSCDTFMQVQQMMEYRLSDGTIGYGMAEQGFRLDSLRPGPAYDRRMANSLFL